jgi:hypothetical protein
MMPVDYGESDLAQMTSALARHEVLYNCGNTTTLADTIVALQHNKDTDYNDSMRRDGAGAVHVGNACTMTGMSVPV